MYYLLKVRTESYDEYFYLFHERLDDTEEFLKTRFPEEYKEVGFVNYSWERIVFED